MIYFGGYVGTINRFEDLKVWQAARNFVNQVYLLTQEGDISKDFWLKDQIRRAAGSVMHNIAEGFDAGTDRYFIQFLGYARRSASEVQSQLYSALDQGYISQGQFKVIYELSSDIKRQINGLIKYLAQNKYKQVKEETAPYVIALEEPIFDLPDDLIDYLDHLD